MLHQLLTLTRPLYTIDTETTGVDPRVDRIIELGLQKWTADGLVSEWRTLVNCKQPIPQHATKIHGITNADLLKCQTCNLMIVEGLGEGCVCPEPKPWPEFRQMAKVLAARLTECDFAGKHVRFDLKILSAEFRRAQVPWSYIGAKVIDAERLEQLAVPRHLGALHEKYTGRAHDGAHGALSDVRASTTVIVHQLLAHAVLPRSLDALHEAQWTGWLTAEGEFRVIDGEPCITFGKYRMQPMSRVPLDYWDYLLREDFPPDVKQLAADAKMGKFPEVKNDCPSV